MADFKQARQELRDAVSSRAQAADRLSAVRSRAAGLRQQISELQRVLDPQRDLHKLEDLKGGLARAEAALKDAETDHRRLTSLAVEAIDRFSRFTQPEEAIRQLNDRFPILLFPVRLETRFKTVSGRDNRESQELWVRVYPDDCSIDTFEATLSKTEVANAQLYWTGIWEAGGIKDQERGAWRRLVGSQGAGRAEWIISQYQPLNLAEKPTKPKDTDVILTISTDTPLATNEAAAIAAYWRSVWLAEGAGAQVAQALADLEGTVGGAGRAAELTAQYEPANIKFTPAPPLTRNDVTVTVAFVVFPRAEDTDVKQTSWSRAPRATLLPDRFVFLGFAGSGPPLTILGNPVPPELVAGPDPEAPEEDRLQHDADGNLIVPAAMSWMTDFPIAVLNGMGFRIGLTSEQAARGFDRIVVLGIRFHANSDEAKSELEELLTHHRFGRDGISLVPQGTPTNNTENSSSGFDRNQDADESFDDLAKESLFTISADWRDKSDGQWLAEYLGIDPVTVQKFRHAGGKDQADARAMNTALFPATLGYWMESMMQPVFAQPVVDLTREFFNAYVSGRGPIPALRIGHQPYGILPTTALSRLAWMKRQLATRRTEFSNEYISRLYDVLRKMQEDWQAFVPSLSHAATPGDPHRTLLDIVGLHSGSVEYAQRYAQTIIQFFNQLNLTGLGGLLGLLIIGGLQEAGKALLNRLGFPGETPPKILELLFMGRHNELRGPVIDDVPLSETEPIRVYTKDGLRNYIQWLIDAANANKLYDQSGFKDGKLPQALLYIVLRHALQLGYHDTSIRLHQRAGLFNVDQAAAARNDQPFLHIAQQAPVSESRYQILYKTEPVITGNQNVLVADFIANSLAALIEARSLREQVDALERLKDASTARLERAFAEHIDCCSYRLDAWLTALVKYQLTLMRNIADFSDVEAAATVQRGLYLGAYGWLENIRPEHKVFSPVELNDPDLRAAFQRPSDPLLTQDNTNQGFIHAPSLNHAAAAAVLRNGYISNASPQNRQTMAVNVTSERVRTALAMIEGIRNGQSLGALLGYQFERGLHDSHNLAEVDKFIFKLRKAFPLAADRLASTATEEGVSIEAIEARNVMDGLALVNHIKAGGAATYPFGKNLPVAITTEAQAINIQVNLLLDAHDAVADLALAEGVYQAVLGNYDRVAATYDAYARGNFPPEPQVAQTPVAGAGLTHRVGLHLASGVDPTVSPVAAVPMTPRATVEPALNQWLADILPAPNQIGIKVSFLNANTHAGDETSLTLKDLDLQPADLLALIRDDSEQQMSELDDRVADHVMATGLARPDGLLHIRYRETVTQFSLFEVMPLLRSLRKLIAGSRPLTATDMAIANEAKPAQDADVFIDRNRIVLAQTALNTLHDDFVAWKTPIDPLVADVDFNRATIIAAVDTAAAQVMALLKRAALFVLPQSGWGFVLDFKRRLFVDVLKKAADLVDRWDDRIAEFQALMTAYPALVTDQERFDQLVRAERIVSTSATIPLPADPAVFKTQLETVKLPAFQAKRNAFAAMQNTTRTTVVDLLADANLLLPNPDFDTEPLSFATEEDEAISFTQQAVSVAAVIIAESARRAQSAGDFLAQHDAAATAADRVKALQASAQALLGDDFLVYPEFRLPAAQGDELANALAESQSPNFFAPLASLQIDFPVDTWLYGIARVREKLEAWEQIIMFSGALGGPEPELTPAQVPNVAGVPWLALEFPADVKLDQDRLLYTAHFSSPFVKTDRQCGLLIDEWNEVIPAADATTGVAFHYDRPNNEAPQSMLLVTPTVFRGAWEWEDVVDAVLETFDFAKLRAVEPVHIDQTPYARFLPATVKVWTASQLTISANLALNNIVAFAPQG